MSKILVKDKYFVPYIENAKIVKAVEAVAARINEDYASSEQPPMILSVLTGSIMYTAELMKHLTIPCEINCINISTYEGTSSTGKVKNLLGPIRPLKGKRIIIVEDIVDTGNTIIALDKIAREMGAIDVKVTCLFIKPDVYKGSVKIDYPAMEIGKEFIVGFGLDYNQFGRNYPDIYILDE